MDETETLFSTPEMARVFSAENHLRQMLAFEAALARAEARAGVLPPEAAEAIVAACAPERYDVAALYREAARAGTLAIPLVRALTAQAGEAGDYVHWGATSQDAEDTAVVLQVREGLALLDAGLLAVGATCAALAERHRDTLMSGRTLLQQALPITFGLKAARWLGLVTRQARRLRRVADEVLVVQFGGAAGTLAALGAHGLAVSTLLAQELGLAEPDLPWHAERDRIGALAGALGVVAGAMAKIAQDLVLLGQSEVGEVAPGAGSGKGGSSAMPQKRNPVDATFALASARLALGQVPVLLGALAQEHERAAGGWQAEWDTLPRLFRTTAGAVARVHAALAELEVDAGRMAANLAEPHGLAMAEALTMALAPRLGRPAAYRLAQAACERAVVDGIDLREAALADPGIRAALPEDAVARIFDPHHYLGSSDTLIDRALAGFRALSTSP
ncbi:MAG TPA: 3-carboxy-cis,cis-muconate cycloisomerase [Thermomicrobiaceae bacterium]|nr:3-carboxy-cis,cis-muconate cycloisomerase [Thermomicrobiaceae bacterium]